ncbi:hypothetical protein ND861_17590 [Leptospira sp. 2 VSF19]|uniref:Prenyltransferase n=1 Tax=Leptospira soteropolitanensis TaxID=2950025 RepID=A0AAW5VQZ8_9LEPT|nr:hypothetical protein [Leptospira soteropolitanensis]MCW7494464.1 hypothetical protein [Leptospira soteropolitanensis]MCW7502058.1 hypothetical protein [Leptospira soteropolitanensis]MCW7524310.1 hypothetical protein [Leptospira soteropolitanensis]MCW7528175.1 hypothetical protein [Leptospira soteropolitanensis]MCW7532028.1 hypothetical protein [Leptospira soteropolitanensis]
MMFLKGSIVSIAKLISFLALDVFISLIANLSFFSSYLNEKIRPTLFLFYLSSVWALYLADHLWDAFREKEPLSERSAFYLRHRFVLVTFLTFSSIISLIIGFMYELDFLRSHYHVFLSFLLFLVFVVTKLSPIPKEILVSGYYTYGIFLPFSSFCENDRMIWIFFLHVFSNVLLTYNKDREFDKSQKTFTLIQWISPKKVNYLVFALLGVGFGFLLWTSIFQNLPWEFLWGMGFTYLWLAFCGLQNRNGFEFKSLCELSYFPMFFPQIIFFFSLLL